MKPIPFKNSLIFCLFFALCVAILTKTCNHHVPKGDTGNAVDTFFINQWRQEKKAKQALVQAYDLKIEQLQQEKITLQQSVNLGKKRLQLYRFTADQWKQRLSQSVLQLRPLDSVQVDSLVPILNGLQAATKQSDQQCDTLLHQLEQTIVNRDSTILYHEHIELSLKNSQQQHEDVIQSLQNNLQKAIKHDQKKNRQLKWVSRGAILLTGMLTSLLILQQIHP